MRIALFLSLCALLLAAPVKAALVQDLDAPLTGSSPLTVRKLAYKLFKGLTEDQDNGDLRLTAEKILRQLGTKERAVASAGAKLSDFQTFWVRGDERRYLLLSIDVENPPETAEPFGVTVLAVYPEGSDEPQDVANIQIDRFCDLSEGQFLPLGPDDAFCIQNRHSNSNQSYLISTLLHIREGRLRRIAEVLTLSVVLDCANSFQESLTWSTVSHADSPYPDALARVTLTRGALPETGLDCPGKKNAPQPKTFVGTYRWSRSKKIFEQSGKGLDELDKFNKDKF